MHLCNLFFLQAREVRKKKKKKIPFSQSTQSTLNMPFSGKLINSYQLCRFRATGEEAWRDRGHWRSGKGMFCLLDQDFARCDHTLKFKVPQEVSRACGRDQWRAGPWNEGLLKHNTESGGDFHFTMGELKTCGKEEIQS